MRSQKRGPLVWLVQNLCVSGLWVRAHRAATMNTAWEITCKKNGFVASVMSKETILPSELPRKTTLLSEEKVATVAPRAFEPLNMPRNCLANKKTLFLHRIDSEDSRISEGRTPSCGVMFPVIFHTQTTDLKSLISIMHDSCVIPEEPGWFRLSLPEGLRDSGQCRTRPSCSDYPAWSLRTQLAILFRR